jgi:hypothetical protein
MRGALKDGSTSTKHVIPLLFVFAEIRGVSPQ